MAAARNGLALAMLGFGSFAIGTDSHIVIGMLDRVAHGLAVTGPEAGQLVTMFSLTYALSAPFSGWLLGAVDRRHALVLAFGVFVVGNLVCGIAGGYAVMALGRCLSAIGAGMFTPLAFAIATDLVRPERRGVALSIVFGGMTVALAFGVPAGLWVVQFVDWHWVFLCIAALSTIMAVLLMGLLPRLPQPARTTLHERLRPAANPRVLAALIMAFLVVLSEFTLYAYIGIVFAQERAAILPAVLMGFGLGTILGNVVVGVVTDHFGPRRILIGAVVVQTMLLPSIVLARDVPGLPIAIAFAWGIVSYMYLVPIQHRLVELSRDAGPMTLSLNSSAMYLGISGGGAVGGALLAVAGVSGLAVGAAIIGAVALTIILRRF